MKPLETQYVAHQQNVLTWLVSNTLDLLCLKRTKNWHLLKVHTILIHENTDEAVHIKYWLYDFLWLVCSSICAQTGNAGVVIQRLSIQWQKNTCTNKKKRIHIPSSLYESSGWPVQWNRGWKHRWRRVLELTCSAKFSLPQKDTAMLWWHHFFCYPDALKKLGGWQTPYTEKTRRLHVKYPCGDFLWWCFHYKFSLWLIHD